MNDVARVEMLQRDQNLQNTCAHNYVTCREQHGSITTEDELSDTIYQKQLSNPNNIRQITFTAYNSNDFVFWLSIVHNLTSTMISKQVLKARKAEGDCGKTFIENKAVLSCIMKIDKTFNQAVYNPLSLKL